MNSTIKLYYCIENEIDSKNSIVNDFLLPHELSRATRFIFDSDRGIYKASHAFLNALCSKMLKINPTKIVYLKNDFGKPYIEGENFHFSLSHSKKNWCLALSSYDVGVDLEDISSSFNYNNILQRFFSEREQQAINHAKNPRTEFYKFWTRKEALLKAVGSGLIDDLTKIDVLESKLMHKNVSYFLYTTVIRNSSITLASNRNVSVEHIEITDQNYFTFFPI